MPRRVPCPATRAAGSGRASGHRPTGSPVCPPGFPARLPRSRPVPQTQDLTGRFDLPGAAVSDLFVRLTTGRTQPFSATMEVDAEHGVARTVPKDASSCTELGATAAFLLDLHTDGPGRPLLLTGPDGIPRTFPRPSADKAHSALTESASGSSPAMPENHAPARGALHDRIGATRQGRASATG